MPLEIHKLLCLENVKKWYCFTSKSHKALTLETYSIYISQYKPVTGSCTTVWAAVIENESTQKDLLPVQCFTYFLVSWNFIEIVVIMLRSTCSRLETWLIDDVVFVIGAGEKEDAWRSQRDVCSCRGRVTRGTPRTRTTENWEVCVDILYITVNPR